MIAAPSLPDFYSLLCHARLDSTSEEAKRRAAAGAARGTLVWALEQCAGHGRRGRPWVSQPGNLFVSLVLRPAVPVAAAAQLGFAAALAVAEACAGFLPPAVAVTLKWPNDVLLDGAKVSGILLETRVDAAGRLDWLVLGIGINLAAFPDLADYPATSLAAMGAADIAPAAMLSALAERFLPWYERWERAGFSALREAWLDRAHGLGQGLRVRLPRAELVGRFGGLDADGALLLETEDGKRRIDAGEIFPAL